MKKGLSIIIVLVALMMLISGCAPKDEKTIVIATKPPTEQLILGEMLSILIEAKTDIKVDKRFAIGGGTSNIHPAVLSGEIDLYPEYTGTGWLFVLKNSLVRDYQQLYDAVKQQYSQDFNIHWTGLYGFNNTYGLAVTKQIADQYNLKTYSDLALASPNLVFAANPDFLEREDGLKGLEAEYGFTFKRIAEIDIGLRYDAIKSDDVDVITVFSTDGRLQDENIVILEDDKAFFASYYAATVVRAEILEQYPELEAVLELMTGLISNEEMIAMNYAVEVENRDPEVVAREFLKRKGLIN